MDSVGKTALLGIGKKAKTVFSAMMGVKSVIPLNVLNVSLQRSFTKGLVYLIVPNYQPLPNISQKSAMLVSLVPVNVWNVIVLNA